TRGGEMIAESTSTLSSVEGCDIGLSTTSGHSTPRGTHENARDGRSKVHDVIEAETADSRALNRGPFVAFRDPCTPVPPPSIDGFALDRFPWTRASPRILLLFSSSHSFRETAVRDSPARGRRATSARDR